MKVSQSHHKVLRGGSLLNPPEDANLVVSGGYPFVLRKTQELGRNSEGVFAGQMPGAVDACEREA